MTSRKAHGDVTKGSKRSNSKEGSRRTRPAANGEAGVVTVSPLHDQPTHGGGAEREGEGVLARAAPEGDDLSSSHLVKVSVLGAPGVGKTSLIKVGQVLETLPLQLYYSIQTSAVCLL